MRKNKTLWIWQGKHPEKAIRFGNFRMGHWQEYEKRQNYLKNIDEYLPHEEYKSMFAHAICREIRTNIFLHQPLSCCYDSGIIHAAEQFLNGEEITGQCREANIVKAYARLDKAIDIDKNLLLEIHQMIFSDKPGFRTGEFEAKDKNGKIVYQAPPPDMASEMLDKTLKKFRSDKFLFEFGIQHVFSAICPFNKGNSFIARMLSWKAEGGFTPWSGLLGVEQPEYWRLLKQHLNGSDMISFSHEMANARHHDFDRMLERLHAKRFMHFVNGLKA